MSISGPSKLPVYEDLTVESLARLDPDWINLEGLKKWLRICDKEHGAKCGGSSTQRSESFHQRILSRLSHSQDQAKETAPHPQWLIDVHRGCLISAGPGDRYAALSYVWGQVPTLKSVKDNLLLLKKEGAIATYGDLVPKTIRHAIDLTKRLDIPYLWVDCLCIVQDDKENLHRQLQDMASIYASAYVTIVAANGWDANHGLRGIKGVTDPRQLSPNTATDIYESLQPHTSIWYSRGWTMQEMVFSRRTIMLQYQVAIWECRSASWHEATKKLKTNDASDPSRPQIHINPWGGKINFSSIPNPEQYVGLIRDYNIRKLTFHSDAHRAITGLLSVWSQSFHGGFISGLPQMFFEAALLWQPRDPMQRRSTGSTSGHQDSHIPSWSWLGWEGEVYDKWLNDFDFYQRTGGGIHPMVSSIHQWFYGNSVEEKQPVSVSSTTYLKCTLSGKARQALPKEWRSSSRVSSTYYHHKRLPASKFAFPIPLPDPAVQVQVPLPFKYLFCQVQRGFFRGEEILGRQRSKMESCLSLDLLNSKDEPVGTLRLNESSLSELRSSKGRPKYLGPKEGFELVAISSRVVANGIKQTKISRSFPGISKLHVQLGGRNISHYYNVMWIEWIDGVAYRKALGQIEKEAWESSSLEWIDLTLG
jgi:hypothetical protein